MRYSNKLNILLAAVLSFGVANTHVIAAEATHTPRAFNPDERFTLVESGGQENNYFGRSVAISGDYLAVASDYRQGTVNTSSTATAEGAVYIYKRNSNNQWIQEARIPAPPPIPQSSGYIGGEWFGYHVALDGKHLAINAIRANIKYQDEQGNERVRHNQGAFYMYHNDGSGWQPSGKITPSDVRTIPGVSHQIREMSLSGNHFVIGHNIADITDGELVNRGAAYAYRFDTTSKTWGNEQKIVAFDGRTVSHHFGKSVAVSGNHLIIGAAQPGVTSSLPQGVAYAYTFNGGAWQYQTKFTASNGTVNDAFANKLRMDGKHLLVQSKSLNYLFELENGQWVEKQILTRPDRSTLYFGTSLALHGNRLAIGDIQAEGWKGAVFTYRYSGGKWHYEDRIANTTGAYNDQMSFSVAISDNHVVAGAVGVDIDGKIRQGKTYIYTDPFVFVDGFESP